LFFSRASLILTNYILPLIGALCVNDKSAMNKTEYIFHEFIKWIIYFSLFGLVAGILAGPVMFLVIPLFVFVGLLGGTSRAIYLYFSKTVTIEQVSTHKLIIKRLVAFVVLISLNLLIIKLENYT